MSPRKPLSHANRQALARPRPMIWPIQLDAEFSRIIEEAQQEMARMMGVPRSSMRSGIAAYLDRCHDQRHGRSGSGTE